MIYNYLVLKQLSAKFFLVCGLLFIIILSLTISYKNLDVNKTEQSITKNYLYYPNSLTKQQISDFESQNITYQFSPPLIKTNEASINLENYLVDYFQIDISRNIIPKNAPMTIIEQSKNLINSNNKNYDVNIYNNLFVDFTNEFKIQNIILNGNLLYGTYPTNDNEILIDGVYASYLLAKFELTEYEQLLGKIENGYKIVSIHDGNGQFINKPVTTNQIHTLIKFDNNKQMNEFEKNNADSLTNKDYKNTLNSFIILLMLYLLITLICIFIISKEINNLCVTLNSHCYSKSTYLKVYLLISSVFIIIISITSVLTIFL